MTDLGFGKATSIRDVGESVYKSERPKTMLPQFCAIGFGLLLGFSLAIETVPAVAHSGHEHHHSAIKRSVIEPRIPRLTLVRDDGAKVEIGTELELQGP